MKHHFGKCVLLALAIMVLPSSAQEEDRVEVGKVEVGSAAPNFTVANDEEQVVELKDYLAEDHVVLVFVRAHW